MVTIGRSFSHLAFAAHSLPSTTLWSPASFKKTTSACWRQGILKSRPAVRCCQLLPQPYCGIIQKNVVVRPLGRAHCAPSPDGSSLDSLSKHHGLVDVLGEHSGSEPVRGGVAALYDLIERLELEDLLHGSEDLLLSDAHVVTHVREHGRLDEEAITPPHGVAPALHLGPLVLAGLEQVQDFGVLLLVNLRGSREVGI